jgi:hypothetical protein
MTLRRRVRQLSVAKSLSASAGVQHARRCCRRRAATARAAGWTRGHGRGGVAQGHRIGGRPSVSTSTNRVAPLGDSGSAVGSPLLPSPPREHTGPSAARGSLRRFAPLAPDAPGGRWQSPATVRSEVLVGTALQTGLGSPHGAPRGLPRIGGGGLGRASPEFTSRSSPVSGSVIARSAAGVCGGRRSRARMVARLSVLRVDHVCVRAAYASDVFQQRAQLV